MASMSGTARILDCLSDGRWHPHQELYSLGVVAHSRISDLRKRGHVIEMRRVRARYDRRQWTWFYRLAPLNAVAGLPGEGHVVPSSATEDTATATALSGARSSGDLVAESAPPRKPVSSPLPSPTTPAIHAVAAVLPETGSALSLFDVPNEPAWA